LNTFYLALLKRNISVSSRQLELAKLQQVIADHCKRSDLNPVEQQTLLDLCAPVTEFDGRDEAQFLSSQLLCDAASRAMEALEQRFQLMVSVEEIYDSALQTPTSLAACAARLAELFRLQPQLIRSFYDAARVNTTKVHLFCEDLLALLSALRVNELRRKTKPVELHPVQQTADPFTPLEHSLSTTPLQVGFGSDMSSDALPEQADLTPARVVNGTPTSDRRSSVWNVHHLEDDLVDEAVVTQPNNAAHDRCWSWSP